MTIPSIANSTTGTGTGASNNSVTLAVPTGGNGDGDGLLSIIGYGKSGTYATVPSGWTFVGQAVRTSADQIDSWRRTASSEPSDYTWDGPGGGFDLLGFMFRLIDVDTTAWIDANSPTANQAGGPSSTATATGFTTSQADTLAIACIVHGNSTTVSSVTGGWATAVTHGPDTSFSVSYTTQGFASGSSATGDCAFTLSGSTFWAAMQIGIVGASAAAAGHPVFVRNAFRRAALVR